jgi:predicted amidohydrolase YtcJ
VATLPLLLRFSTLFEGLSLQEIRKAEQAYFRSGVTTAQDILATLSEARKYKELGPALKIDINGYFLVTNPSLKALYKFMSSYGGGPRFKARGAKVVVDGSIQMYTASLGEPYWVPKEQQYDDLDNYTYDRSRSCLNESCGDSNFPFNALLSDLFLNFHNHDFDVLAHCNGDQALDDFLDALLYVRTMTEHPNNTRFVAVHAQTVREDQLDAMANLGATPSFFSPHIYYWGDEHYRVFLGPQRANRMNPAQSALRRRLAFTLHNDSPVVLMGEAMGRNTCIEIMEAAINRKTSSGRVLGSEQRISAFEALKAMTLSGARQAREEKSKGSISVGKVADFVILSDNPLTIEPSKFGSLKVLKTIKSGEVVYTRRK